MLASINDDRRGLTSTPQEEIQQKHKCCEAHFLVLFCFVNLQEARRQANEYNVTETTANATGQISSEDKIVFFLFRALHFASIHLIEDLKFHIENLFVSLSSQGT
jgi:hypothetical protein